MFNIRMTQKTYVASQLVDDCVDTLCMCVDAAIKIDDFSQLRDREPNQSFGKQLQLLRTKCWPVVGSGVGEHVG